MITQSNAFHLQHEKWRLARLAKNSEQQHSSLEVKSASELGLGSNSASHRFDWLCSVLGHET